jgi:hypothetical protein
MSITNLHYPEKLHRVFKWNTVKQFSSNDIGPHIHIVLVHTVYRLWHNGFSCVKIPSSLKNAKA